MEAGLTPYQALDAATVKVARLLGLPRVTGIIGEGGAADLVLLEGNPLTDIRNVRRQAGVVLRGAWMPHDAIQRRLDALAQTAAKPPER